MQQNYLFNGGSELERGLDIGWYHTIFRDYDPSIGRFIQIDPLTDFFPGITSYSFAFDNPVSYDDPDGLAPMWFLQLRANLKQAWYNVTGRGNQHAIIHGKNHGQQVEIGARTAGQRPTPNPRTQQVADTYGKAEEKKEDPGPVTPPGCLPDPPNTPPDCLPDPPPSDPTFKDIPIPPGKKINYTERIKFNIKSDHFSDENTVRSQLGDLVKLLMNNTGISVHIVGNVMGDGIQGSSPEALAQPSKLNGEGITSGGLMNARARAVFNFLVKAGVNPKQLSYGYGNVMKGEAGLSVSFRISNK
jgi:RHS repeat-associated protein